MLLQTVRIHAHKMKDQACLESLAFFERSGSVDTKKLCDVVEDAMRDKGLLQKDLATHLDIDQGHLSRLISRNMWPISDEFLGRLAVALDIRKADSVKKVKRHYIVDHWFTPRTVGDGPSRTTRQRARFREVRSGTDEVEDSFADFKEKFGKKDYLLATTVNVFPLIYYEGEKYEPWRKARFEAIARGMISVLVTPTKDFFKMVSRYFPIQKTFETELKNGVANFKRDLRNFLMYEAVPTMPEAEAKAFVNSHVAHFEWHEFPLTAVGWTLVLVGHDGDEPEAEERVLIRGPVTNGKVCYIQKDVRDTVRDTVKAMHQFGLLVLKEQRKILMEKSERGAKLSLEEKGTLVLIMEMLKRMGVPLHR